jgi:hypothetical protein
VPPASPDPRLGLDARAAVDAVLEPLRAETDRVDRALADNQQFLEERRSRGVDAETRALLTRAAESPTAPDSLRGVARRVAHGEITWDDVFAHRAGAGGAAFLDDAFRTAQQHFADADVPVVRVPDEALEVGIEPDEVSEDLLRTRVEAREAHDAIFRRAFEQRP